MAKATALRRFLSENGSLAMFMCMHRQLPPTALSALSLGSLRRSAMNWGDTSLTPSTSPVLSAATRVEGSMMNLISTLSRYGSLPPAASVSQ